jgi:hypothetical protein
MPAALEAFAPSKAIDFIPGRGMTLPADRCGHWHFAKQG